MLDLNYAQIKLKGCDKLKVKGKNILGYFCSARLRRRVVIRVIKLTIIKYIILYLLC